MLSVLVSAYGAANQAASAQKVVRTLGSLVPAAVDGLVRDVQVLAPGSATDLAQVADHAGCTLTSRADFASATAAAAAQARCSLVLVLEAGVVIDRTFVDELAALMPSLVADGKPLVALKTADPGLSGRLWPSLAATLAVLTGRDSLKQSKSASFVALVRALRPRRSFRARATWAG